MKRAILLGLIPLAFGAGQAWAQNCTNATTAGMTPTQIRGLVSGQYACVGASPNAQWDELHTGSGATGMVLDYKLGPSSPTDPSDTPAHPTGTYAISAPQGAQAPGLITYTYGSGSFAYRIVNNLGAPLYSFCGIGAAPQLAVTISPSHC